MEDLSGEIERLKKELAAAVQESRQSAAYGLELLNEKENLQKLYDQSKNDLKELREAWNKAKNEQKLSATTVFEKEVQLLNDNDALTASFTQAKLEIEKELNKTKSQLDSALLEKERYLAERDELLKKVPTIESERKQLRQELKELKSRETKLLQENSELEEENVNLQKQVSNLRSSQVDYESSKHEIQRLQDETIALNSQLEEVLTIKRITERQMQEALEALQSEREQKYALRKELDKRNSADPLINWTSLAALKGNLALQNLTNRSNQPSEHDLENSNNGMEENSFDLIHELEMPSIEGSLFDEVHLTEIKKLQQNLEEKENQRSNLNTKVIEIQHKLDSKIRQADEIGKKLETICALVEETYNETMDKQSQINPTKTTDETNKKLIIDEVTSTTKSTAASQQVNALSKTNVIDDFDNIYSHLQTLITEFKSYQEISTASLNNAKDIKKEVSLVMSDMNSIEQAITAAETDKSKNEATNAETLNSDDVQTLRVMLYKKQEQLKQLRTVLRSNKESAEVALANLKSKYDMEKAIVAETMTKLRLEHKRLNEDAATFASLRSHFSARIEEYNTEIEKLQSKLSASEQEKNTLNSILRMAIEQKVMLTQKLEALEMDREDGNKNSNGHHQPRSGVMRGSGNRNTRTPRSTRPR